MIKELRLQNFRCYQDHVIPFKAITVAIGRNNAGKSTLVEALRLVAIVSSRYKSLPYNSPPRSLNIPLKEIGISPSLKGMEFNFKTVFHQYKDPPAIITATFTNGSIVRVYLDEKSYVHAVVYGAEGTIVKSRREAHLTDVPMVEIMPQVGPVSRDEVVLSIDYVKSALSSSLASSHFRNQLSVLYEHFASFKTLVEETWPSVQIRELVGRHSEAGEPLQLAIREGNFVADIAWMGHGLQMWLQTMWFIARTQSQTIILDEPDVYMHPDLQRRLIRFLKGRFNQVIITTHSVEIMSEVDVDDILVVDRTRGKSSFAGNLPAVQKLIDHVGSVHNIHLARLWNAKCLLLVEGKDMKLLSALHDIIFPDKQEGFTTIPNMAIGGWGNWHHAVGSSMFLKNSGGEDITVYCVLDSDYHTALQKQNRMLQAQEAGVQLHIWKRKEIENYCIIPDAISRAIKQKQIPPSLTSPSVEDIKKTLESIMDDLHDDIFDAFSSEILSEKRSLGSGGANKEARAIVDSAWTTFEGRQSIVSGKEVISRLSEWSQANFGVSLNAFAIIKHMEVSDIPKEAITVLSRIEEGKPFSN